MSEKLTFDVLREAVAGNAAAFRSITKLQPMGGPEDKVFPPTYAGGVYAVEDRRIDGRIVRCVLLDSVQSQANRMEEALLEVFLPGWRELKTNGEDPKPELPVIAVKVGNYGWVTSLTAPHRVHDAILRDSNFEGDRFRDSKIGKAIVNARLHDATAFYRYCPTVLLFGTWDSTAGADSAKIPRAVVSEIIGVDITPGVRTGSRIDPLGIGRESAAIYRRAGNSNDWTLSEDLAERDNKKNPVLFGKGVGRGTPAAINHGNIPPDLARFGDSRELRRHHLDLLPDILQHEPVEVQYQVRTRGGELSTHSSFAEKRTPIRGHAVKPGGVTMAYGLHTWTLSLTQLRRVRFPVKGVHNEERNIAGRSVLAALGLYALALQREMTGYWLRSRCELISEGRFIVELVGGFNGPASFMLSDRSSKQIREDLINPAMEYVAGTGLSWEKKMIRLTPTEELLELVRRSEERAGHGEVDEEEAGDVGTED